jgi:hypothetical protein
VCVGAHTDAEQEVRAREVAAVLQHEADGLGVLGVDRRRAPVLDHVHAAAEEDLLEHLGQVGVVGRKELVASRDERHPRAAAREEVRELAAGRAGAEHHQMLGHVAQLEHLARGQHPVCVRTGERRHER